MATLEHKALIGAGSITFKTCTRQPSHAKVFSMWPTAKKRDLKLDLVKCFTNYLIAKTRMLVSPTYL